MKVMITKSKGKWAKKMDKFFSKRESEAIMKMFVESLTGKIVTEIRWEK